MAANNVDVKKRSVEARPEGSDVPPQWSSAEVAHLQRLAVVGELCAETAHEVNQPLAAIKWFAEAAVARLKSAREQGRPPSESLEELLETIAQQADAASQLNARLFGMARRGEEEEETFRIDEVWQNVLPLVKILADRYGVKIAAHGLEHLPPLRGDPLQIGQVVLNLVRNGIEAVALVPPDRRRIEVRGTTRHDRVIVEVRDFGPGAPDEVLTRLFQRFFTTRRGGTGLGLAISKSIIEEHGGEIEVERNPDHGLTFRFELPRASDADS